MLRKRLAADVHTLFIIAITGAAFASPPASGKTDTAEKAAKLSETFSVLHAVGQWSINLSEMADERAKSDLVKDYARAMATANANTDAKLMQHRQENMGSTSHRWTRKPRRARACSTASRPKRCCSALSRGMPSTRST